MNDPRTTPAVLDRIARDLPDHDALISADRALTYAQLRDEVRRAAAALIALGVQSGDRVAIWSPNTWHWVVACLATHYAGGVLVPLNTRYTASEATDILARSETKVLFGMGRFLKADRLTELDRDALPALAHVVRVPIEKDDGTWDEFVAAGASVPVTVATTCGRPIADFELRIDDGAGGAQSAGAAGEVLLRSANNMLGYLDDPEATAAAIDADGWLHTGDVGTVDAQGNLRITDRLKDMYICGGFNVYPAEIEQVLARLDGVADAAVIGVPDDRLGEVGRAFVVRRPGSELDEASVIAYTREHLANFKAPRSVTFVDDLPRNPGGKVVKPQLREWA